MPSIHLITGYLGSGKTQFLSRLLEGGLLSGRVAVIVNDFGAVVFDGVRLAGKGTNVEIIDVPGGCLCCSAIEDFQTALAAVIGRGANYVFIEATGLADAAQVQRDLAYMRFPVDSTLCVVDVVNLRRFRTLFHIVDAQIAAADFLLLSKTDLVPAENLAEHVAERIASIEAELRRVNARARIVHLANGRAEAEFLTQAFAPNYHFVSRAAEYGQGHLLRDKVTAFRIVMPLHVDFATFEQAMANLRDHVPHLVRFKGFIQFADAYCDAHSNSPHTVMVNYVAGAWNYQIVVANTGEVEKIEKIHTEETKGIPNVIGEFFAIGQDITIGELRACFNDCAAEVEEGTVNSYGLLEPQHTHVSAHRHENHH
jgi:G3E family GTPase